MSGYFTLARMPDTRRGGSARGGALKRAGGSTTVAERFLAKAKAAVRARTRIALTMIIVA